MESSVSADQRLKEYKGWTHKFIFPPYEFSIADSMITNFHTPMSTLMMMTAAFAGHDFLKEAYAEAIKEKIKIATKISIRVNPCAEVGARINDLLRSKVYQKS